MNFLSSSVPCNHRSETPQGFISAQATARVTTFSFPLFILSDAPPGRLYPVASFSTQPQHLRKSVNLKTASLGLLRAAHSSRSAFRAAPCRCAENYTWIIIARQADFSIIFHFFVRFFIKYAILFKKSQKIFHCIFKALQKMWQKSAIF